MSAMNNYGKLFIAEPTGSTDKFCWPWILTGHLLLVFLLDVIFQLDPLQKNHETIIQTPEYCRILHIIAINTLKSTLFIIYCIQCWWLAIVILTCCYIKLQVKHIHIGWFALCSWCDLPQYQTRGQIKQGKELQRCAFEVILKIYRLPLWLRRKPMRYIGQLYTSGWAWYYYEFEVELWCQCLVAGERFQGHWGVAENSVNTQCTCIYTEWTLIMSVHIVYGVCVHGVCVAIHWCLHRLTLEFVLKISVVAMWMCLTCI